MKANTNNAADGAKLLVIATEAYGGFGGIAVFNCDLLDALTRLPYVRHIMAMPRLIRTDPQGIPKKVRLNARAAKSVKHFALEATRQIRADYDLIICTHVNLLPFAKLASLRSHAPILCVLHGIEAWEPTGRLLVDRLSTACARVIAVSQYTKDRFIDWSKYPSDLVTILPNCVRQDSFGMGPKPDYLVKRYGCANRRVIMTLARLDARERQKGIDEFLQVMPQLTSEIPDLKYLIAGGGDDRPRLAAKVADLGLDDYVTFCGLIDEAEKADHYRLCDVFTMAGRQEGFGIVFLEALATGAAVIASELDGSRDAVLNGALGELANPDDPQTLITATKRALNKPRQIPAKLEYFSFENFVEKTDVIIRPLISPRSP